MVPVSQVESIRGRSMYAARFRPVRDARVMYAICMVEKVMRLAGTAFLGSSRRMARRWVR